MARFAKWRDGYGETPRQPSNYVLARSLAASTAESMTVPNSTDPTGTPLYVVFSCTANYYVNITTTATVPGDVTDGSASELNPAGYMLPPECTTISVISPSACVITAAFYRG